MLLYYLIICLILLIVCETLNYFILRKLTIKNGYKIKNNTFLKRYIIYFIPLANLYLIYIQFYYAIKSKR